MSRTLKTILTTISACLIAVLAVAAPAGASTKLKADYRFEGNFKSATGSVARLHPETTIHVCPCAKLTKTNVGGTRQGVWQWPQGDGLRLGQADMALGHNGTTYTFVMLVKLHTVDGYRKLIDFDNLQNDPGIYAYNGALSPYPYEVDTTDTLIQPGGWYEIAVTRSKSGVVKGYRGGVCAPHDPCVLMHRVFTVSDPNPDEVLGPDGFLHFLEDDAATSGAEASAGQIARLRIFNGPLSGRTIKRLNP